MLIFSGLVAGSFVLGSRIAPLIDPVALNALRFVIAAAVMGVVAALGPGLTRQAFAAPWRYGLLAGIFCSYFVLMFVALRYANPVATSAVFTLTPLMTAVFGWLILRQRTTPRMALALATAAAGAVWVIFGADIETLLAFRVGKGEAIFFAGCIAHALYPVLVAKFSRGEPVAVFSFCVLASAALILCLVGFGAIRDTDWAGLPGIVWGTVIYLAVFASALTFFLIQFAALRLPGAKVMAYTYAVPVWVILLQGLTGQGWPPIALLLGVALVTAGLLMLLRE